MTTILNNFVAVRKSRGDVLNPSEYRSIVGTIRGIINDQGFKDLKESYGLLLDHLLDFNDPHKDSEYGFIEEIIAKVYDIYVIMLPTPLSFADFKSQIVPTLQFLELIRRIVLNRLLYLKVKNPDGSVPSSVTITLTDDWIPNAWATPYTLDFGPGITDGFEFIKRGWANRPVLYPVIFNAIDLAIVKEDSNVIFSTSSDVPYFTISDNGNGFPVDLKLLTNTFRINVELTASPTVLTNVFSLSNGVDVVDLRISSSKNVAVRLNGSTVLSSDGIARDGSIVLTMNRNGSISLTTSSNGIVRTVTSTIDLQNDNPLTNASILIGYENNFVPGFGLKSFVVYSR